MPRSLPATVAFRLARSAATAASFSAVDIPGPSRRPSSRMRRRSTMAKETRRGIGGDRSEGLSKDEVESQVGEQLPNREQMSLINANIAAPINAAIALNVLSDGSVAYANAQQYAPISQGNVAPAQPV